MKFKKNSWHYRLNKYTGSEPSQGISLCMYFWSTIFKALAVAGGCLIVVVLLLSPVFLVAAIWTDLKYLDDLMDIATFFSVLGCIGLCGFYMSEYGNDRIVSVSEFVNKIESKPTKAISKGTGLAVSFVKAKKQKICPLIEFEE